ncbi:MAG: nucleotide sugar dehydrogenase [Halanaerobiales bacterium]|nr:nucleotide sugar dehydrogenase [Halanaerobiales bacterium]
MTLFNKIIGKEEKVSIIGLGYVGLPLAVAFDKKVQVIGFDISEKKIEKYISGIDPTKEVGNEVVRDCRVEFTSNPEDLKKAKFHIVAVPTPIKEDHSPDLSIVKSATRIVGKNLLKDSYIVFESTVYPGVTEDICIPILEEESGLKAGIDFKVGYSPERINPGDTVHRLDTIVKVVSGQDKESLDLVAKVYELVVDAGVYKAESIKVAEAAKVIENSQRDINIAFMNELSIIFNKLDIDTKSVLKAAGTKWNFLGFFPGLVGGHCIGVDPYYLTYKAEQVGYHSQIILSGRKINDNMGKYVVENIIKKLIHADVSVKNAKVALMGFTFKENCPDTRNTRVIDIVNELKDYGINPMIVDPVADLDEATHEYNLTFYKLEDVKKMDAVVFSVAHDDFKTLNVSDVDKMFKNVKNESKVIIDVKGIFDRSFYQRLGYRYWRL